MPLFGQLAGAVVSRGQSGANPAVGAPSNPPTILSFTLDDMTLDTGVAGTFSWTKSGAQTSGLLDPGDGSASYTLTTQTSQAHTYDTEGVYDATLTLTGPGGTSTPATINDIVVSAASAPAVSFKNWGAFSSGTETMRNATGSTVADVPMYRLWQFHRGAVPTTKTLQLRDPDGNIVPTTDWQWDSRVTYPDGSLQSCIVRFYGPASWTTGTDKQWTVEAITGSWPAETSSHTVAHLTAASDVNITLTGVRRIGPNDDTTQVDHTYTTLTWSLNYWIAQTGRWAREQTGAICSQYMVQGRFRNSTNNDNFLWAKVWVDVYYEPGTTTVREIILHPPQINNGWANADGRALAFKCALTDGATTLRDYTETLNLTAANCATDGQWNIGVPSAQTNFVAGTACYVASGTPPTGMTVGKLYQQTDQGMMLSGNDSFPSRKWYFHALGKWGSVLTKQTFGSGLGGSWSIESWLMSTHMRPMHLSDVDGWEFHLLGVGAKVTPNHTRAEKLYRMQVGQYPNVDLDDSVAQYNMGDRYTFPCGRAFHRETGDFQGGLFQEGYHIGEVGIWGWNVLVDMTTFGHHQTLRRAAAEVIGSGGRIGFYDQTAVSGVEVNQPVVVNNGPDKAGAQYTNLGPSRPGANLGSRGDYNFTAIGFCTGDTHNNIRTPRSGMEDGTHTSCAAVRAYELFPSPVYREIAHLQWMGALMHALNGALYTGNAAGDRGTINELLDGTVYYRISSIGLSYTGGLGKRNYIGANAALKCAQYAPDNTPLGPYMRDVVADQIDFVTAFFNSTNAGDRAKIVGPMTSLDGSGASDPLYASTGGQQHWQLSRIAASAAYVLKVSGIESEEALQWFTGMSRVILGDPVSGTPMRQAKPGALFGFGINLFDDPAIGLANYLTDDQSLIVYFKDAAAQSADASTVSFGAYFAATFGTDGQTVTIDSIDSDLNIGDAFPLVGDLFALSTAGSVSAPTPPTGISMYTWYYLYDVAGSGSSRTYKLSSTDPAGSVTPVTWTAASPVAFTRDFTLCRTLYEGTFTGGRMTKDHYGDYIRNCVWPVTAALTLFGTESGCGTANANWESLISDLSTGQSAVMADPSDYFYSAHNTTRYHAS